MNKPPPRLYKYMHPDRKTILDDWRIRFTQPKALNDPFEMRPYISGYSTPAETRRIAECRWEEHIRDTYGRLLSRHQSVELKPHTEPAHARSSS